MSDRRGMPGGGIAVGGGAGLLLLLLGWLFGGDLGGMLGGNQSTRTNNPPIQDEAYEFAQRVLGGTDAYWTEVFAKSGRTYNKPSLTLFTDSTPTACGTGQAGVGPFYCPNDQTIYYNPEFFRVMETRFGARGEGAAAYVIAHEVGHHVQNELGIMDQVQRLRGQTGPNSAGVRLELQADCLAGVWAGSLTRMQNPIMTTKDINEGRIAAQSVGDDALQQRSQGYVNPESFTHGSSEQRDRWFSTGVQTGDPNACNTFR